MSPHTGHGAGLCGVCRHHRVTGNRRGSRFYLCELSKTDARFPRYPALPVVRCAGFEHADRDPWNAYSESQEDEDHE
jgi:hypothetical protein